MWQDKVPNNKSLASNIEKRNYGENSAQDTGIRNTFRRHIEALRNSLK